MNSQELRPPVSKKDILLGIIVLAYTPLFIFATTISSAEVHCLLIGMAIVMAVCHAVAYHTKKNFKKANLIACILWGMVSLVNFLIVVK